MHENLFVWHSGDSLIIKSFWMQAGRDFVLRHRSLWEYFYNWADVVQSDGHVRFVRRLITMRRILL